MSRNGIGNFNASDVIRRNQERMLAVAKLRNDNAKQQLETLRGLQSGLAGGKPITSLIIPAMKEAALTLTIAEYNQIVAEFTSGGSGGEPVQAPASAPAPTVYVPQGTPARVFSLPYTVQGIVLDAAGDRIILTYDTTTNTYYIYKVLFSNASGAAVYQIDGNDVAAGGGNKNLNLFLTKNSNNNYYIGGYQLQSGNPYPTIIRYDSLFQRKTAKVLRDANNTVMKSGGINCLVATGENIFCSGWYSTNNPSSSFLIDSALMPAPVGGAGRITPFFGKFDDALTPQWFTTIAPETANALGSGSTIDSQGNVYASVAIGTGPDNLTTKWVIRSSSNPETTLFTPAQHVIVKFTSLGAVDISAQFFPYGYNSFGYQYGSQLFVDASDNIFIAYSIEFVVNTSNIQINFGNGVIADFNRNSKSRNNFVILKLNSSLVAQAIYQLEMPSDSYKMWPKSVTFDASNNLLVNAGYKTNGQITTTIRDNHGNDITLSRTISGSDINEMDLLISNDLTTVKWYYNISGINTDSAYVDGYYRNNGSLIVDNINNRLIKIDERANTGTVTVAAGLTLPASTGIQKSFMVEYT